MSSKHGIYFQNLGMIITNKCNLDCKHCCRGCKDTKDMSKEVIDKVVSQTSIIGNLAICGGEPTMAIPTLEYLLNAIMKSHIMLEEVSLVINGSIYSEELLRLLDEANRYMQQYLPRDKSKCFLDISVDEYHTEELKRLNIFKEYLQNISKYSESAHFDGIHILKPRKKLFREGNAQYLDKKITIELRPIMPAVTYVGRHKKFDRENGLCNMGPLITVNTDGIITECDSSIEHQDTIFNYGNVLEEPIEEIVLKRAKVLKPNKWYRACCKEIKRNKNYNK